MFASLLKSFNDEVGFVRFQIESYNDFIENGIQKIFDEIGEVKPDIPEIGDLVIKFGKVTVGEPQVKEADGSVRKILPTEARIRDLTYAAPVFVEIKPIINKIEQATITVQICDIPVMLKSKICPLSKMSRDELEANNEDPDDPGGYFIINGVERMLVLIEEVASNKLIVQKQEKGNYTAIARLNSEAGGYVQRHIFERKNDGTILVSFASIKRLPVTVLIKALGVEKDIDIVNMISGNEKVKEIFSINLYEPSIKTAREAYEYIGNELKIQKEYIKSRVDQLLDKYFLPHLGQTEKARDEKAKYLAWVVGKLIQSDLGMIGEDDIDHYGNKRIKLSSDLFELLLRSIMIGRYGLLARIKYNYQKMAKRGKLPPIHTIVESNIVTTQIVSAMGTGTWPGGRTGVTQRLERKNLIETLSYLRLILSPLSSTQEHFEARELHATHFGRFCPAETPEGPTIGLRKHLALFAQITKGVPEQDVKKLMKCVEPLLEESGIIVILDGKIIGYTSKPLELIKTIVKKRREGVINKEINAAFFSHQNEVIINTMRGRVRRPLIVVESGMPKLTEEHIEQIKAGNLTWKDLVEQSIIEYIDADEEENALVALNKTDITAEHGYLEISPLVMLGVSSSLIPYAQHDRGDRVNLGSKMICQAIGIPFTNFPLRVETKYNILTYPQTPLTETVASSTTGINHHPIGQNVVVAIASYTGYNMEDGIIFNKASIERGLFRSFFYRVYSAEEKRYGGGQRDKICIPEKDVRGYRSEEMYAPLSEDGIINPEIDVEGDSVLVGRVSPFRFLTANEIMTGIANMRDTSICMRPNEAGTVDKIFVTENINENKLIKVAVRDLRIPELGDKFASRHGQKNVIGLILPQEDMPFSASGIIPDIIFNPHAIQSRQTVGHLIEILVGKVGALSGKKIDTTPFIGFDETAIRKMLQDLGFRSDGKEVFYNGYTGERMVCEIFTGMQYYLKLDHMVANKLQCRARGPVTLLTRQPTEGKAKEGGLRLGEMEKDVLIAHGAVLTLKERFDSDKVIVPICRNCGIVAEWNKVKEAYTCQLCGESSIAETEMSYAFKLMLDELKAMCIYPKIEVAG